MRLFLFLSFFISTSLSLQSQAITAKQVVEKSIQYHDPDSKLIQGDYIFHFEESRPNGTTSKSKVRMAPQDELYELNYSRKGTDIFYRVKKSKVEFSANGSTKISKEVIEANRLSKERGIMMKNYYLYLWHLPMKINDPGTILHEQVKTTFFDDKEALEIKVTYTENVGKDIWYFYFHPLSYKMIGYRFYHDESANDGEYILLDEEVEFDNIKLPAARKWYMHKDDKFLGTDKLVRLETTPLSKR